MKSINITACAGLILAILITLVYVDSYDYGFLIFDDKLHVYGNEYIPNGLTIDGLAWALTTYDKPYFMPLTRISLMLDSTFFGMSSTAFRSINIVLHFFNSLLLFLVVRLVSRSAMFGLVTAALFAVHPQHVEAVAWISQRKEMLAAFFGLIATMAYAKHVVLASPGEGAGDSRGRWLYPVSVLSYLASVLAKPTWIMFPLLLILVDYWIARERRSMFRIAIPNKVPFALVSALILAIHLTSSGYDASGPASTSLMDVDSIQRVLNSFVIYAIYLACALFPFWSSIYFPYPVEPFPAVIYLASIALVLSICAGIYLNRRNHPKLLFGWLWFLVALVPVVGLMGTGEAVLIGDRWSYLPHIGLTVAFVQLGALLTARAPIVWRALPVVIMCTVFVVVARTTTHAWRDDQTYWLRTIERTDGNHFAHFLLSNHYARSGDGALREAHLRTALQSSPDDPKYLLNLAIHLMNTGRDTEAHLFLDRMLGIEETPVYYLGVLGQILMYKGQLDRAHKFLVRASTRSPSTVIDHQARRDAMFNLAVLYSMANRPEAAREVFERLIVSDGVASRPACERYTGELNSVPEVVDLSTAKDLLEQVCQDR